MARVKKSFHWAIIIFAVADVAMGIMSLFTNELNAQILALVITSITLYLTIIYSMIFCKGKKFDVGGVIIGSADFIMTVLTIIFVTLSVQVLEIVASGMTLAKAIKIIIQSDKAKRLIKVAKPVTTKIMARIAPVAMTYATKKIKENDKIKGVFNMEKVKEFFVKLGNLIRANKVSLLETVANGGAWGVLGWLVNEVEVVAIQVGGFNITPLFAILGFALIELGFQWESFGTFIARISPKLAERLEKRKAKEEKKALKEAEAEKEKLIAQMKAEKEAERKAQEEKELEAWLAEKKQKELEA